MRDADDVPRMLSLDEALRLESMAKEEVWVVATDPSLDLRGVTRPVLEHNLNRGIRYKILVPKSELSEEERRKRCLGLGLDHAIWHEMTTEEVYGRSTGMNAGCVSRCLGIATIVRPRCVPKGRTTIVDPCYCGKSVFPDPACIVYFNDEGYQRRGQEFRIWLPLRLAIQIGQDFVEHWNANQKTYGEQSVIEPPIWTLRPPRH